MGPEEELRRQHFLPEGGGLLELAAGNQAIELDGLLGHGIDGAPNSPRTREQTLEGDRIAAVEDPPPVATSCWMRTRLAVLSLMYWIFSIFMSSVKISGVMSIFVFCGML